MEDEIKEEWLKDAGGKDTMDFKLFSKTLFRIAHGWAVNVDLEEYLNLLSTIYSRITWKSVITEGESNHIIPQIKLVFEEEERKLRASSDLPDPNLGVGVEDSNDNYWDNCVSGESNNSDYEYKYEEDEATMSIKKFKRRKNEGPADGLAITHIKDPIKYREEVTCDCSGLPPGAAIIDELMEPEFVLPLGYPTEQYLLQLKNSVYMKSQDFKEEDLPSFLNT
jgi:hypothetical protein